MTGSAPCNFCQNNTVMLTYTHNHALGILLWQCFCHRNEKQNFQSFFSYNVNLTSVITKELKFFFLCELARFFFFFFFASLAVTSSMLKIPWNFEILLLNFGYTPGYMELCHFFFSSALGGAFRTLINIYDGAIRIDNGVKC